MTGGTIFSQMTDRVRSGFGSEIAGNRRLQLALLVGAAILWVNITLLLVDVIESRNSALELAIGERRRFEAISKDDQWPQRQAAAEALAERAQQRLWPAESEAIARAEFQEWVLRMARESGLGRPQVRIEREVPGQAPAGSQAIAAQLSADFTPEAFTEFLKRIAGNPRLTVVTSLRIQKNPVPRIDAILTGFTKSKAGATS
jgi:hypothetical protein